MKLDKLIDPARVEIKLERYGTAPATALVDITLHSRVQDYRRQTGLRMYPLSKRDISRHLPAADYHVSRKMDGEFTVLIYREGQAITLNPGGTVRVGMPWLIEAAELLEKAGTSEAVIAGELYTHRIDGTRGRIHDVLPIVRGPKSQEDLDRLRFAAFDVISLDDTSMLNDFANSCNKLETIFSDNDRVHPVEAKMLGDSESIAEVYRQWVEGENAEGMVIRSELAGLFKLKPRHNIDAVVVGFTESTGDRAGMIHDLLVAVMRDDGAFHLLCRIGNGFGDDLRRELLQQLRGSVVESDYAEVNSDHVAYQMVTPDTVVELSCIDLVFETSRGGPVNRMVLSWNGDADRFEVVRRLPLASIISPRFVRIRDDKSARPEDVRINQISDLVEVPLADRDAGQMVLSKSELLGREVYTKEVKGKTMIRKFLLWKTNKETENETFPAFVIHYTDFSPNRKVPLQRDVRISNSREQIQDLWLGMIKANIKKGWMKYEEEKEEGAEVDPG
jgi:hypothetical protein